MAEAEVITSAPPRRKIARAKRPAPPPIPEAASPKNAPPTSGAPDITTKFVAALVIGGALGLLGLSKGGLWHTLGVLGPITATAAYPIWGLSTGQHRNAAVRERFADNSYYLGFIFTQWSLVLGFLPAALLGRVITSTDILRYFGLALGASLIGLIFRTVIVQTGHTSAENMEIIEGEMDAVARLVTDRSKKVLGEFETLTDQLARGHAAIGANLNRTAEALDATMRRFESAVRSDTEALEASALATSTAAAEAGEALAEQQRAFAKKMTAATKAIEGIRTALGARAEEAGRAITSTTDSLTQSLQALQDVAGVMATVQSIEGRFVDLNGRMDEIGETLEASGQQLTARANAAVEATEAAARQVGADAADRTAAFSRDLDEAVRALEQVLTGFRQQMERIGG